MQLRDAGKLTLDDPVTRLIPELRQMHNPFGSMDAITIRMLLNHSAGFQAPTWPYKQGLPWEPFEPTRWEQLVAMMPYQQVEFAPGAKFSYSNPAWIYAARIVELLTGDHWQYYMQKNIFTPLEMTRSYFGYTPNHLRTHRSHRYIVENGKSAAMDYGAEFDPGITIPNGGWNSPVEDAAAYIAFLTAASGRDKEKQARFDTVLRRSTLEEMWQPQLPLSPTNTAEHMGYAFFLDDRGSARLIGHTGGQGGFSSFFHVNPANGRGIVAAFNTASDGDAFSKLQALAKQALLQ
jgi:CubicO group peptidase (beta-lactamase class C family)